MSAHVLQNGIATGRQMVMLATVGFHVLVIAILMTFTIQPDPIVEAPRLIVDVLTRTRAQPPPEPMPIQDPEMRTPDTIVLPLPEPVFPRAASTEVQAPVASVMPPAVSVPVITGSTGSGVVVPAPTDLKFEAIRSTDDYYPSTSVRLQEEGITVVRVCVGPDGRLAGMPTVESTSGSGRLDAAAVTWAREALRFTPATREGRPVSACKGFRVRFNLR